MASLICGFSPIAIGKAANKLAMADQCGLDLLKATCVASVALTLGRLLINSFA